MLRICHGKGRTKDQWSSLAFRLRTSLYRVRGTVPGGSWIMTAAFTRHPREYYAQEMLVFFQLQTNRIRSFQAIETLFTTGFSTEARED